MLGTLLSATVSVSAVVMTAREHRRVTRLGPAEPKGFVKDLRVGTPAVGEAALRKAFPDEDAVFDGILTESKPSRRAVATVNEQLSDIERELSAGAQIARSAVRMALFSATLGGVVELVSGLSVASGAGLSGAGRAFFLGCAGAAVCFELGRRRGARAEQVRGEWDSIAQALALRLSGPRRSVSPQTDT